MKNEKDSNVTGAGEIIETVLNDIDKRKPNEIIGLPTGFLELDGMLSGLQDGNLIVAAGHPGTGTTALALRIAEHLSIDKEIPTLYFSMGLGKERLIERMLLGRALIDLREAREGKIDSEDKDSIKKTSKEISKKPLYVDDTDRLDPGELRDTASRLKNKEGIGFIVVDSLQLMRLGKKIDLKEKDFAEIARVLKMMARELNLPVLLLVELSFELIRDDEERVAPRLADLGEAIGVERYADVLMLLNREGYYGFCPPDSKRTEIVISKNRNGAIGSVYLDFHDVFARFEDLDRLF